MEKGSLHVPLTQPQPTGSVYCGLYARLYRNLLWSVSHGDTPIIQIHHRSRPARMGYVRRSNRASDMAADPVVFAFDRKFKLTSLKVVPVSDIETNKYPHPIWHLVSTSNAVPINEFAYGMRIQGMRPAVQGATPDPLEPGVRYRLLIEAGKLKAEHDFVPVPCNP